MAEDRYTCPAGKYLTLEYQKARIKQYMGHRYKARQRDCSRCKLRKECLSKESTRQRYLFVVQRRYNRNY